MELDLPSINYQGIPLLYKYTEKCLPLTNQNNAAPEPVLDH